MYLAIPIQQWHCCFINNHMRHPVFGINFLTLSVSLIHILVFHLLTTLHKSDPHCHHHLYHHKSLLLFFTLDLKHTSSSSLFHRRLHHRYSLNWSHGRTVFLLLIGFVLVFSSRLSAVDWAYICRLLSALYKFSFLSSSLHHYLVLSQYLSLDSRTALGKRRPSVVGEYIFNRWSAFNSDTNESWFVFDPDTRNWKWTGHKDHCKITTSAIYRANRIHLRLNFGKDVHFLLYGKKKSSSSSSSSCVITLVTEWMNKTVDVTKHNNISMVLKWV